MKKNNLSMSFPSNMLSIVVSLAFATYALNQVIPSEVSQWYGCFCLAVCILRYICAAPTQATSAEKLKKATFDASSKEAPRSSIEENYNVFGTRLLATISPPEVKPSTTKPSFKVERVKNDSGAYPDVPHFNISRPVPAVSAVSAKYKEILEALAILSTLESLACLGEREIFEEILKMAAKDAAAITAAATPETTADAITTAFKEIGISCKVTIQGEVNPGLEQAVTTLVGELKTRKCANGARKAALDSRRSARSVRNLADEDHPQLEELLRISDPYYICIGREGETEKLLSFAKAIAEENGRFRKETEEFRLETEELRKNVPTAGSQNATSGSQNATSGSQKE